jgi:hypothetical protein
MGCVAGSCVNWCPHSMQNLLPGGLILLHSEQLISNFWPHSLQNFAPTGVSNLQRGHFIFHVFHLKGQEI